MNFISRIVIGGSHLLLTNPDEIGDSAVNWSSPLYMIGQFFFLAAVFIFIIFLAVYSLRIAARFKGINSLNSNLKIIESRSLGGQNYAHIIKAGNKYLVVGSSKEKVSFLAEIEAESVSDVFNSADRDGFEQTLSKQIKKFLKKDIPPEE